MRKKLHVSLSADLHAAVCRIAAENDETRTAVIQRAVRSYIRAHERYRQAQSFGIAAGAEGRPESDTSVLRRVR